MTPIQIELLTRCIRAVRFAQDIRERNVPDSHRWRDFELVEVGWFTGVSKKTADSLVRAGLLVENMPSWANENTNTHVRLPRLDELTSGDRGTVKLAATALGQAES